VGSGGVDRRIPDNAGLCCELSDKTVGLNAYHVVHVYTPGATACRYSAQTCLFHGDVLSDTNMFPLPSATRKLACHRIRELRVSPITSRR